MGVILIGDSGGGREEVSGNAVFLGKDISAGITGVLTDISADITDIRWVYVIVVSRVILKVVI